MENMDITGDIMKIKMRQFFSSVVIAAVMAVVMPLGTVTSYAATEGRIAFSDKTASVGDSERERGVEQCHGGAFL